MGLTLRNVLQATKAPGVEASYTSILSEQLEDSDDCKISRGNDERWESENTIIMTTADSPGKRDKVKFWFIENVNM
jgi:hypothetical protein